MTHRLTHYPTVLLFVCTVFGSVILITVLEHYFSELFFISLKLPRADNEG